MLLFCTYSLLVPFAAHVLWWRICLPAHQVKTLGFIFLVTPLPAIGFAAWLYPEFLPASFWQWLQWLFFYVPCCLVYIGCYTLLELRSPTLTIMQHVAAAGPSGCPVEEIRSLRLDTMLGARLSQMEASRLIEKHQEHYRLTNRGAASARLVGLSTRALGIRAGG